MGSRVVGATVGFKSAREVRDEPNPLRLWLVYDDEPERTGRPTSGAKSGP